MTIHTTSGVNPPMSPKVKASTLGSLGAGLVLALIDAFTSPEGASFLAGLPPILAFILLAIFPPIVTFLSGYNTKDPLQRLGFLVDRKDGRHEA